jgi:hypothetical protein
MGKILQKAMCPALMALDLVIEIGSAAIPGIGKAITVGISECEPCQRKCRRLIMTGTGVKTAKMFKHAYDAQDAATEWASIVSESSMQPPDVL